MKYSILDKIKCKFGFHNHEEYICELPNVSEMLFKCNCCERYHLWHYGVACGFWFKKSRIRKHLSKEIIEKYDL